MASAVFSKGLAGAVQLAQVFSGVGRRLLSDADAFSIGAEDVAAVQIDCTGRLAIGADSIDRNSVYIVQVATDVVTQLVCRAMGNRKQIQRFERP
ncbi:hypothetical protein D3C81_2033550 [compost metagenome]